MLNNFDDAVVLITDDYIKECDKYRCTLKELFKAYMMSDKDIRNEFLHILEHSAIDQTCFDDLGNITNTDGTKNTFKQLKNAVFKASELRKRGF